MSCSNRVAALLAGCPDPGRVLYPQTASPDGPTGAPAPRRVPVPKVSHLVLPASGVTVRGLAELLGLPAFAVMRACVAAGWFFPHDALLDHATIHRRCSQFGVSVAPAL